MNGEIAVVGSGAAGMAAAFRLQQAGWRVRIFEANDKLGGRMSTSEQEGFLLEHGANMLSSSYHSLLDIVREARLEEELLEVKPKVGILRDGEVHYLVRSFVGTRLFSTRSKLALSKLAVDLLRARRHLSFEDLSEAASWDTQSAGDYARGRLTPELLELVVDPASAGFCGVSADELSVVNVLFGAKKFFNNRWLVFRRGMGSYPELLGRRFEVELGARVAAVEERKDEVIVTWRNPEGVERSESMRGCVVAVPAPTAAEIVPGLDAWRADFLRRATYSKLITISLALSRAPAGVPATYVATPKRSRPGLIGFSVEHNKNPGSVPPGKGLLSVYTDSRWDDLMRTEDDDVVAKQVIDAMDQIFPGLANDCEFAVVKRWADFSPTHPPGFWQEMRQFQEIRRSRDRQIQLAGDYFSSTLVNTASVAGERAARDVMKAITGSDVAIALMRSQ